MATAPMSGGPYLCAGILIRMRGMHIIVIARVIAVPYLPKRFLIHPIGIGQVVLQHLSKKGVRMRHTT